LIRYGRQAQTLLKIEVLLSTGATELRCVLLLRFYEGNIPNIMRQTLAGYVDQNALD
jgi:hypothetical protein